MKTLMILALLAASGLPAGFSFAQEEVPQEGAAMLGNCQTGWRWCSKCDVLSYVEDGVGPCPAGGTHATGGSDAYVLVMNDPKVLGSQSWRRCSKCVGLFHSFAGTGVCPSGGAHDSTGSAVYTVVPNVQAEIGQLGWAFCSKCDGFFYAGHAPHGVCPAGGEHTRLLYDDAQMLSESSLPAVWGVVAVDEPAEPSVAGASVKATRGSTILSTKTKADGTYSFTQVPAGIYAMQASKRKTGSASGTLKIKKGGAKSLKLYLKK